MTNTTRRALGKPCGCRWGGPRNHVVETTAAKAGKTTHYEVALCDRCAPRFYEEQLVAPWTVSGSLRKVATL